MLAGDYGRNRLSTEFFLPALAGDRLQQQPVVTGQITRIGCLAARGHQERETPLRRPGECVPG
jgi:hypothetical protein